MLVMALAAGCTASEPISTTTANCLKNQRNLTGPAFEWHDARLVGSAGPRPLPANPSANAKNALGRQ